MFFEKILNLFLSKKFNIFRPCMTTYIFQNTNECVVHVFCLSHSMVEPALKPAIAIYICIPSLYLSTYNRLYHQYTICTWSCV